jgi:hypothetical protein
MGKKNRNKWLCLDCKRDTSSRGLSEHYFVNLDLWMSVVGSKTGMLCIGCLEKRIGRKLIPSDFPNVHINRISTAGMSIRLIDRISPMRKSKV